MLRLLMVAVCYLTGTALSFGSVALAAGLFLWNDIFRPLTFARAIGIFPVAYYVLVILILSYVINLFRGLFKPQFGTFFIWFLVLMAWILVTLFTSPFRAPATTEYIRYLKYLLPLILIYTAMRGKQDIRVVSAALAASVAVWAMQAGVICLIQGPRIDLGIAGGQMSDRNDFSAAIVGTLPWFLYFGGYYRARFKVAVKIGIYLALFLSLAAIVLSLSRGASVGLSLTVLCYIFFLSRKKARDLSLAVILLVGAYLVLPQAWFDRMHTIELSSNQTEGSAHNRMALMQGAWRATLDRPVFGWGPDGWLQIVDVYGDGFHSPHNIYLKLSSEAGFPGLALYLVILLGTLVRMKRLQSRAMKAGDKDSSNLAIAFAVSILGLMATMTFLNVPFNEYLWAWITLANAFAERYKTVRLAGGPGKRRGSARRTRPVEAVPEQPGAEAPAPHADMGRAEDQRPKA